MESRKGLFDSYDDINQWMENQWDISYDEWLQEAIADGWDDANREDWYDENEGLTENVGFDSTEFKK